MTYQELANFFFENPEKINRRVYKENEIIFSFIKMEYNYKDNIDASRLIDSDLAHMLSDKKLKKLDKICKKLNVSLSEIINLNISKKHLNEIQTEFKINFLNKKNIHIYYLNIRNSNFFMVINCEL
jgi:mevalonate kinase